MKKIILFTLLLSSTSFGQKFQLGVFSMNYFPSKKERPELQNEYGIGTSFGFRPKKKLPVVVELNTNIFRKNTDYTQPVTVTTLLQPNTLQSYDVKSQSTITTNLGTVLLGVKWFFTDESKRIRFFVTPQFGGAYLLSHYNFPYLNPNPDNSKQGGNSNWQALPTNTEHVTFLHSHCNIVGGQIGSELFLRKHMYGHTSRIIVSLNYLVGLQRMKIVDYSSVQEGSNVNPDANPNILNLPSDNYTIHDQMASLTNTRFLILGVQIGYIFTVNTLDKRRDEMKID